MCRTWDRGGGRWGGGFEPINSSTVLIVLYVLLYYCTIVSYLGDSILWDNVIHLLHYNSTADIHFFYFPTFFCPLKVFSFKYRCFTGSIFFIHAMPPAQVKHFPLDTAANKSQHELDQHPA